jgi:hypothetical protein
MNDVTTDEEISKKREELNEASQDLRDTLTEVSAKAEHLEEKLRLDRMIESSPIGASCLAGALGFVIGSRAHPSAVGPAMIFALLGERSRKASQSTGEQGQRKRNSN